MSPIDSSGEVKADVLARLCDDLIRQVWAIIIEFRSAKGNATDAKGFENAFQTAKQKQALRYRRRRPFRLRGSKK